MTKTPYRRKRFGIKVLRAALLAVLVGALFAGSLTANLRSQLIFWNKSRKRGKVLEYRQ